MPHNVLAKKRSHYERFKLKTEVIRLCFLADIIACYLKIMYKELEKYKTGKKINTIGVLPDKSELVIRLDEYCVGLGDLMQDFINHTTKSKFKRKYYHDHLTKIYKDMLNKIDIQHGL